VSDTQAMSIEKDAAPGSPLGPPAQHLDDLRACLGEAERGEFLDDATTAAYLRWLEAGEGTCPWPPACRSR
jgi:hypothetical protein